MKYFIDMDWKFKNMSVKEQLNCSFDRILYIIRIYKNMIVTLTSKIS